MKSDDKVAIGGRIRIARISKGLRQHDLAHLVNVGLSTVSAWESGDRTPPIARLKEVASALNVNINYLLGEKEIEYCVDSVSPVNSKEDEFLWDILNRSLLLTPKQRKLTLELITLLFSKENES